MASGSKVTVIESSDEESGDNKKTSNEPAANTKSNEIILLNKI